MVDRCVCQLQGPPGLLPTPEPPVGQLTRQTRLRCLSSRGGENRETALLALTICTSLPAVRA